MQPAQSISSLTELAVPSPTLRQAREDVSASFWSISPIFFGKLTVYSILNVQFQKNIGFLKIQFKNKLIIKTPKLFSYILYLTLSRSCKLNSSVRKYDAKIALYFMLFAWLSGNVTGQPNICKGFQILLRKSCFFPGDCVK